MLRNESIRRIGEDLAMNRIVIFIIVISISLITPAGPVSALEQKNPDEKELCILYASDCADKVYNLQGKIRKIQDELAKGSTVYKADEVKKLKEKLKEAEEMMNELTPVTSSKK